MSQEKFWSELKAMRAVMLSIGEARHVPMSPYVDEEAGAVWFMTAQGVDLVKALEAGHSEASMIVGGNGDFHARVEGHAGLSTDRAMIEKLWNPIASTWFDGKDDPDIRLIRLQPKEAEVWSTPGSLGFLVKIAKAKITGQEPDMGEHFTVRF